MDMGFRVESQKAGCPFCSAEAAKGIRQRERKGLYATMAGTCDSGDFVGRPGKENWKAAVGASCWILSQGCSVFWWSEFGYGVYWFARLRAFASRVCVRN